VPLAVTGSGSNPVAFLLAINPMQINACVAMSSIFYAWGNLTLVFFNFSIFLGFRNISILEKISVNIFPFTFSEET